MDIAVLADIHGNYIALERKRTIGCTLKKRKSPGFPRLI